VLGKRLPEQLVESKGGVEWVVIVIVERLGMKC
jgi:hypothetical protein